MMRIVVHTLINAVALWVAAWLVGPISLSGDGFADTALTAVLVALVFGLVNFLVKPLVKLLSLPLFILTLGLITFVINALMLMLTSWASDHLGLDFHVDGFWAALLGSFVVSLVSWGLNLAFGDD